LVWLSSLSSVDTIPSFQHHSLFSSIFTPSYFTMSDIYTHEPVQDFTNPFLNFNQGYTRPFTIILPTIRGQLVPISPVPVSKAVVLEEEEGESVLPKKPLTRKEIKTHRGYPRGESQGDSSGRILFPSFLTRVLKNLLQAHCLVPTCLERGRGGISQQRRRGRSKTNICLSIVTIRVVRCPGGTTRGNSILLFSR